MQQDELADLRTQADAIHSRDVHLGRLLHALIDHVARLSEKNDVAPKAATKEKKTDGN